MQRRQFLFSAPALAAAQEPAAGLEWHDAWDFTVEGLGFPDRKAPFDRLPGRAEGVVRKEVWDLSRDPSGVLVRFRASTPALHARWTLGRENLAQANVTAIAASGLDLYAVPRPGAFQWAGFGRPDKFPVSTGVLAAALPEGEREYRIYLPIRNPVAKLEIGVPQGGKLSKAAARPAGRKPVVFYGTSITHGFSASRSGMTHPAILGRRLDREIINLGFSGNGRMEPEVLRFIAELDPAVFVLDCLPNMNAAQVRERVEPGVLALRKARPRTPILLVEDRNYADNPMNAKRAAANEANHAALREVFAKLRAAGVPDLAYLPATGLLGADGEDTIDGSHPNDLGFVRQADGFEPILRGLMGE
jgi:hypothetical protein